MEIPLHVVTVIFLAGAAVARQPNVVDDGRAERSQRAKLDGICRETVGQSDAGGVRGDDQEGFRRNEQQ